MDTNPDSLEEHPLGTGLTDEDHDDHQQIAVDHPEDSTDPSDYDPRNELDDEIDGVQGQMSIHGGDATSDDQGLHDLDDLGDLFPH